MWAQTEGLSHGDSLLQTPYRINCPNWVLGHLLDGRGRVLGLLGLDRVVPAVETRSYVWESEPVREDGPGVLQLSRLPDGIEGSGAAVVAALRALDATAPVAEVEAGDGAPEPLGSGVHFPYFHDAYHTAQTDLLRRVAGVGDKVIQAVPSAPMRLVVARCSVDYSGRLSAHLPPAVRLIMVKADGCVAVHADGGAYKPLNWMNAPNHLEEDAGEWRVTNGKGEALVIRFEEVLSDSSHEMGTDPGLDNDGVEANLQELLAEHPSELEDGLRLLRREYPTDIGPVDLLCRDAAGGVVAVEIKRRGEIDGVEQLTRYLDFLNRDPVLAPVRGILAAQVVRPQARTLAADRGIGWVEVDYDRLRGIESNLLRLF